MAMEHVAGRQERHRRDNTGWFLVNRGACWLASEFPIKDHVRGRSIPCDRSSGLEAKARTFTLDGESVVCDADGVAVFDALHRYGKAFDLLELDGVDYRPLPLGKRKKRLARFTGSREGRDRTQRAHRCHGRAGVRAGLQDGFGGHRVEKAQRALSIRAVAGLAQDEKSGHPAMMRHRAGRW
jgi:hypothetical protein